jgi:hypothetical protein
MRLASILAVLFLGASTTVACAVDTGDDVESESSEIVQFPAAQFASAPTIAYGQTSPAIDTSRTKWGILKFAGKAGDDAVATVTATTDDRRPRVYLVEKRGTKYVSILSGTNGPDGLLRAKLEETKDYYLVFREFSRRVASFTVHLDRAGALPASCTGTPLLEKGIVERTPQAEEPGLATLGAFESHVRRCNVATGCAAPTTVSRPNASLSMSKRSDGKWLVNANGYTAEHDGTTGELTGTANVRTDDNRTVTVALSGAATTGCISLSGRDRVAIDELTYYDVEITFRADTPPVADRTAYPATPPATECDGQDALPDEELLARFPVGAAHVALGAAHVMEDQQYCHPQTGCRDWTRGRALYNNGQFTLTATGRVLSRDTLGVSFVNNRIGTASPTFVVDDGILDITRDVLGRTTAADVNVAQISDTHISVKEKTAATVGQYKYRRYVCIPMPAHP